MGRRTDRKMYLLTKWSLQAQATTNLFDKTTLRLIYRKYLTIYSNFRVLLSTSSSNFYAEVRRKYMELIEISYQKECKTNIYENFCFGSKNLLPKLKQVELQLLPKSEDKKYTNRYGLSYKQYERHNLIFSWSYLIWGPGREREGDKGGEKMGRGG